MFYLNRLFMHVKNYGLLKTFLKILYYPIFLLNLISIQNYVSRSVDIKDKFTRIYKINYWGSTESVSGNGSTLKYTKNIRIELPKLYNKFNVKSVFDAPCGDFNWMQHVVSDFPVKYIGGDIVGDLVKKCNSDYKNENVKFIEFDLTKDKFPDSDLMICRDCLFHLSYKDINKFFNNFLNSNIKFLLTTTFVNNNDFKNNDIITGDFRKIDLYSKPFNIPRDKLIYKITDDGSTGSGRELHLFKRKQLKEILNYSIT